MPKIPGVSHLRAIKAFEKAGFRVVRQRQAHCHERRDTFLEQRYRRGGSLCFHRTGVQRFFRVLVDGERR